MDPGIPRMSPQVARKACLQNQGYELPELNEVLILNYKGFRKIEGLEEYSNVRSVFLECNGIMKIENLEMPHLVSLYLQSNSITRMENLELLSNLQYLNLAHNRISEVENLGSLRKLETLNLASNTLQDVEKLQGLTETPTLRSVDLSSNYFEDGESLLSFWPQHLPEVQCLYLHRNPCSRGLKDARRRLISSLQLLRWIDERPVTGMERAGAEAWAQGGREAEMEAKQSYWRREKEEKDRSFKAYLELQEAAPRVLAETQVLNSIVCVDEKVDRVQVEDMELREADPSVRGPIEDPVDRMKEPRDEMQDPVDERKDLCDEMQDPSEIHPADEVKDVEDLPKEEAVSEWTGFKDKVLGRLVAESRYNFRKASEAFSKEFAFEVSEQECRRRYGELCRPQAKSLGPLTAQKSMKENSLRAVDGPPVDAAAVKEVSEWFVRRIAQGNGQARATKAVATEDPKAKEADDTTIHPSRMMFSPPERLANPVAPAQAAGAKGLFDLD